MAEYLPLIMFAAVFVTLLAGYAVAPTLAGVALLFAFGGAVFGVFDLGDLGFLPNRIFGIITNQTLIAVPLFVLMGVTLQRTHIAETLLKSLSALAGFRARRPRHGSHSGRHADGSQHRHRRRHRGHHGAHLPAGDAAARLRQQTCHRHHLRNRNAWARSSRHPLPWCLLGDVLSSAYQQAQLTQGVLSPKTVSVGDLFAGALVPGLVLVVMYLVYIGAVAFFKPERAPGANRDMGSDSARNCPMPAGTCSSDSCRRSPSSSQCSAPFSAGTQHLRRRRASVLPER